MRLVETRFTVAPHVCCVTNRTDDELVDFEVEVSGADQRVYMRKSVVEEAGGLIGMVPKAELAAVQAQLADLKAKFSMLERVQTAIESSEQAEEELTEAVAAVS